MTSPNLDREKLISIIEQWNANRLELFALSKPNEDLEFLGVMRFYFQDSGQKVATKCIRISSTATTKDVIHSLIEKFRPDIKMLSFPEYALYEIHETGEERKLADDEKPLLVQLNWHNDDREGRFLLRRMDEKTVLSGFDPVASNLRRKLSKREKKKREKKEKDNDTNDQNKDGIAEKLYNELPETAFTRSISNPEAVMRRRRAQKFEKKLKELSQEGRPNAGGTLRIFGECLNKDVPYKTLLLSTKDTASYVVQQILDKYRDIDKNLREGESKEIELASNYCLVQIISNSKENFEDGAVGPKEYILDDDDCPLDIKQQHQASKGILTFHIRRRPADYQPRKRKKKPKQLEGTSLDPDDMTTGEQMFWPSNGNFANRTHFDAMRQMNENFSHNRQFHDVVDGNKCDAILPAILELWEEEEDIFLNMIITDLDVESVAFKLAPTYTLYMGTRYRASTHFKKISPEERAHRLTAFTVKVASMIHQVINEKCSNPVVTAFWLANSSELLHFLKQDRHLSPYTLDAQDYLATSVTIAFRALVDYSQNNLQNTIALLLQEHDDESNEATKTAPILNLLSSTMALLRRCRINAALTIQLFSQLFHFINMWLFNKLLKSSNPKYYTDNWGFVMKSRLSMIGHWARNHGLEMAAECHLGGIAQAADLLIANKTVLENHAAFNGYFFRLNSLQVRRILECYNPAPNEPYISPELIEAVVSSVEANADAIVRNDHREVKLEEDADLKLPFLLPDDGYSCEFILGIPSGLPEFIQPLVQNNLCRLTIQPTSLGKWTIYLISPKPPKIIHQLSPKFASENSHPIYDNINHPLRSNYIPDGNHCPSHLQVPRGPITFPVISSPTCSQCSVHSGPYYPTQNIVIIKLKKTKNGLGLSIVAARNPAHDKLGIYIKSVVKGGAADMDGRLQSGDQLLKVDGHSLIDVPQEMAAKLMTQTDSIVTLEVAKQAANYNGEALLFNDSNHRINRGMTQVTKQGLDCKGIVNFNTKTNRESHSTIKPIQYHDQEGQNLLHSSSTGQLISNQGNLKKYTYPTPAISYRYGRTGYLPKIGKPNSPSPPNLYGESQNEVGAINANNPSNLKEKEKKDETPPPLPKSPPPQTKLGQTCPSNSVGFTLKDISEVLEMDEEPEIGNSRTAFTPNVIGAQEVYKDPRERIKAEKMKNQPPTIPGPEKLSFKEKMKIFAPEKQL